MSEEQFFDGALAPPAQPEDLDARVGELARVLSDVSRGDYAARVPEDVPADHALRRLYTGMNEMMEALAAQEQRNFDYQRELEEKLATIDQQRAAIRELSTPIMEVWDGVLCLPIVGVMDSGRSTEMTSALLRTVTSRALRHHRHHRDRSDGYPHRRPLHADGEGSASARRRVRADRAQPADRPDPRAHGRRPRARSPTAACATHSSTSWGTAAARER